MYGIMQAKDTISTSILVDSALIVLESNKNRYLETIMLLIKKLSVKIGGNTLLHTPQWKACYRNLINCLVF